MTSGRNPVWDVGDGGNTVHGQRGKVPRAAETEDPLPGPKGRTYCSIDGGAHKAYAWKGA